MALGLLCHRRRQGDSESACQPVMRSLGQTSKSHDRSNDTAFFGSPELMGSSSDPAGSGVICFKLSYESQRTASTDGPVMGQGHTCIYVRQLPHFQAVTLDSGNVNQVIPFVPNNKALIYPTDEPVLTKWRSVCLSSL